MSDNFIDASDLEEETFTVSDSGESDKPTVRKVRGNTSIFVNTLWQFYFYNKKQPINDLNDFRKIVNATFSVNIVAGAISQPDFEKIFSNSKRVKALKDLFIDAFGDCNTHGIIVLHGPINQTVITSIHSFPDNIRRFNSCFTLLNGDCTIATGFYPNYIDVILDKVRFFQVPHHGSIVSWDQSGRNVFESTRLL